MKFNKAYKFRIYPNKEQKELLAKTFGSVRFLYNKMLEDKINYYNKEKKSLNNSAAQYKSEYPWLKDVDSQALNQAHRDLMRAYKNFFTKQNKFPKFKSKKNTKNSYRSCVVKNNTRIENNKLRLPKIGLVKIKMERNLPENSEIKNVTVSQNATGKYFVSVNFEYEAKIEQVSKPKEFLGLDFSMSNFYVSSDGELGNYPKFFRNTQAKLAIEQRRLSKMKRGSNNYYKQKQKIAKIHETIANQRKDFQHKRSREITNFYDVVCVENLNMKAMSQALNFGKSVNDNSWGSFVNMIEYKLMESGKQLIKADKWFASSKTCSNCGHKKGKLSLAERQFVCESCGLDIDRDINAAYNLKHYGQQYALSSSV